MNRVIKSARADKNDNSIWSGYSGSSGGENSGNSQEAVKPTKGPTSSMSLEETGLPEKVDPESVKFVVEMRKRRFVNIN